MTLRQFAMLVAAIPALAITSSALADAPDPVATAPAVLETKMALRDLWVEHVFWIRSYVLASRAEDEQERNVAEAEVVANAKALAETITPFYGESASDQLFTLLGGHWGAVKGYNTATFGASQSAQIRSIKQLTSNARDIAKFLSTANPYLPEEAVFGLLSAHGTHHVSQIDQIEAGDFDKEAQTWSAMRNHMLVIADSIAVALGKQFPDRLVAQN